MNRKKAVELFAIFFALMLIFTLLSRAADSLTVARVQVKSPGKQVITHQVTSTGKVTGTKDQAVFVEPNQKISRVYVEEGSRVEKGEVLLEVDLEELEQQIESQERAVKQQNLLTGDSASKLDASDERKSQELTRAWEDYEATVAREDAAVARAQQEVDIAYQRLRDYEASQEGFQAEGDTPNQDGSQRDSLEDAIRASEQALEEAVSARSTSVREAYRKIEDAGMSDGRDSSVEIGKLDEEEKSVPLERLQALRDAGGKICAPMDGVITAQNVKTGEISSQGAAFLMVDTKNPYQFVAPIAEDEEQYVEKGASVTFYGSKELEKLKELTVDAIVSGETETGEKIKNLVVHLPQDVGEIGQRGECTVTKESKAYDICVPVSALGQENGKYFVYVVEEQESVLGTELAARKMEVTVLEKNESVAALEDNGLSVQQKIVISTDRVIENGSRVRLEE